MPKYKTGAFPLVSYAAFVGYKTARRADASYDTWETLTTQPSGPFVSADGKVIAFSGAGGVPTPASTPA
jgi:hypothetical protein